MDMDWFPTADQPEWSDLSPIFLTDEDQKFVSILGSEQYRQIMAYLRALMSKGEYSKRGFDLSTVACDLLPSNYTAWNYRRLCLDAINGDWDEELNKMIEVSQENPKTYQVWQHRKMCVIKIGHPRNELLETERYIFADQKNYHVWGYRQWLLRTFPHQLSRSLSTADFANCSVNPTQPDFTTYSTISLELFNDLATNSLRPAQFAQFDETQFQSIPLPFLPIWRSEIAFCDSLLSKNADIRNNSAWNQRMFVINFAYSLLAPHPSRFPTQLLTAPTDQDPEYITKHGLGLFQSTPSTLYQLIKNSFQTLIIDEFIFTASALLTVHNNESAYNYLYGLVALEYKYPVDKTTSLFAAIHTTVPDTIIPSTTATTSKDDQNDSIYSGDFNSQAICPILGFILQWMELFQQYLLKKAHFSQPHGTPPGQPETATIKLNNRFLLSFLVDFGIYVYSAQPSNIVFGRRVVKPCYEFEQLTDQSNNTEQLFEKLQTMLNSPFDIDHYPQGDSVAELVEDHKEQYLKHKRDLSAWVINTCEVLAQVDPIRAKYWIYRSIQTQQRFGLQ